MIVLICKRIFFAKLLNKIENNLISTNKHLKTKERNSIALTIKGHWTSASLKREEKNKIVSFVKEHQILFLLYINWINFLNKLLLNIIIVNIV